MGSSTCPSPPSTGSPGTSSVSIIIINISITFNNVMPGNAGMDKILEMNWFSFILMWAAVFIIDFILAGVTFDQLQKYHKEELTDGCFAGLDGLMAAILFAFETAQTIGYGSRYPEANCPAGIMLTLIHIFVTTMLATLFGGSFLAKFANSSPETDLMFSQKALITR